MGIFWPPGWTRGRRGALCLLNGFALWVTALMLHVYRYPAEWNLARSSPATITEMVTVTMQGWLQEPVASFPDVIAHTGSLLIGIGAVWYWLIRPFVERYTDLLGPIADAEDATEK